MDDKSAFTYSQEKKANIFVQFLFSHVGMFFVVMGYTVAGGYIFVSLESGAEQERYEAKMQEAIKVQGAIDYTAMKFYNFSDNEHHNWNYKNFSVASHKILTELEFFILDAIENFKYDGFVDTWNEEWTPMNCILLAMTIITTIGYGHISPKTFEGQMFCIVYALIGCPLFLVFLANIGDSMANGFIYIYSRCCCRPCRTRRYLAEVNDNANAKTRKHVIDDVIGEEEYMPTKQLFVPIVINIVVLHAYIVLGGIIFSYWEHWDMSGAFYFTFITISTIGYGDLVPGNSLSEDSASLVSTLKMAVVILYIIVGMALLSMCVNLMQEQLVEKCRYVASEIGLSKKKNDPVEPAAKPADNRRDSLMPMGDQNKGPSPFRSSSTTPAGPGGKNIPGIIDE